MAVNKSELTSAQNDIFHENYQYMWEKLSVTYYQVSQTPEKCPEIHGREYLPSYAYLCRCMKHDYIPTVSTVNKIVDFYNANILPRVSGYQFVNERLRLQDVMRHRADESRSAERIAGTYRGYYLSPTEEGGVCGSLMYIQSESGSGEAKTRCVYYADGFSGDRLLEEFDFAREADSAAAQQSGIKLYAGEVQVGENTIFMLLQSVSNPAEKMCMSIDVLRAEQADRENAVLATVMQAGGAPARAFFLGMVRREQKVLPSIEKNQKEIVRLLKIRAENIQSGSLRVSGLQEQKWRAYIKRLSRKAK